VGAADKPEPHRVKEEAQMESRLVALKLLLDGLEVPSAPQRFDDRMRLQKSVYLGQAAAGSLGYRFGWYVHGPYSSGLSDDYYALSREIDRGDRSYEGQELTEEYQANLLKVRRVVSAPAETMLSDLQWLELVASLHFLETSSRSSLDDAKKILVRQKPDLAPYAEVADRQLRSAGLL
jgi:uncharacterized protein YwgA